LERPVLVALSLGGLLSKFRALNHRASTTASPLQESDKAFFPRVGNNAQAPCGARRHDDRRRELAACADHTREHPQLREAGGARGGQLRRCGQGATTRHRRGGGLHAALREACCLAACRGHPLFVAICDVVEDAATADVFLIMEFVEASLRRLLRQGFCGSQRLGAWRGLLGEETTVRSRRMSSPRLPLTRRGAQRGCGPRCCRRRPHQTPHGRIIGSHQRGKK
jgi:hypothetical protein